MQFFDARPWRARCRVTPLKGKEDRGDLRIALRPQITGPIADRIEEDGIGIITFGMTDGITRCSVNAQTMNQDVHRGAIEPLTQPVGKRFILTLAKFRDNLGNAPRRQVFR